MIDRFKPIFLASLVQTVAPTLWVLLFLLVGRWGAAPVVAQTQERPSLEAVALAPDASLVFDGRLDESFWQEVAGSDAFAQQEPREGDAPTERTVLRVVYDKNNLYIGAMLYDSNPDGIRSFQRHRDAALSTDDRFMWILDTYDDGRSAYFSRSIPVA